MRTEQAVILVTLITLLTACTSGGGFVSVEKKFGSHRSSSTFYTVGQGETLYSIAWRYGVDYRQLANANSISAPYTIYPGQKIDISGRSFDSTATIPVSNSSVSKPSKYVAQESSQSQKTISAPKYPPKYEPASQDTKWIWPANGRLIARFSTNDPVNKGIDLDGALGESVLAAAAGTVVYAGQGLRGYGNLIIVKHNDTYLSAYAHTSRILVSEQEVVKAGQKIAEIGSTGTDKVKLHFEVRQNGMPVDPLQYLPARPG